MKKLLLRLVALAMIVAMCMSSVACGEKTEEKKTESSEESEVMDDLGEDIAFEGTVSDNTASGGSSTEGGLATSFKKEISSKDRAAVFKNIPKKLKGTSITFAHWGDEGGAEYVKVAQAFTKLTGINVKWDLVDQHTYASEIAKKIAAGKGPDAIILNDLLPQIYAIADPLPSIFDVNDGFWDPRVTEQTMFNGKKYFVNSYYSPYAPTPYLVIYNKRIYNDNGLTTPEDYIAQGNWSWETFKQCMLDAKKIGYYGGVFDPYYMALTMGPALFTYDAKASKVVCSAKNNENFQKALKFLAECRAEGLCGNYLIAQYPSGNIGMLTTDTYAIKRNGYLKDMSASDYGVVRSPDSFEGKPCNYGGTGLRAYGVCKNAKNPEGVYYFFRYFLDVDNCNNDANIFGNKEMQKFYCKTVLDDYRKNNLRISFRGPLELLNLDWTHSEIFKEVRRQPPEQITVAFESIMNTFESATDEANKKLASFK